MQGSRKVSHSGTATHGGGGGGGGGVGGLRIIMFVHNTAKGIIPTYKTACS